MFPPEFNIFPPLLNSASPWATTLDDIITLYNSPHTGAVTIRTSLLNGFEHRDSIHQFAFFSPLKNTAPSSSSHSSDSVTHSAASSGNASSLNTLGYSPLPLRQYLQMINHAASGQTPSLQTRATKPIILSVTGSAEEVAQCYLLVSKTQSQHTSNLRLMMEINLSCPNIPDKPPPAYDESVLVTYLTALAHIQNDCVKSTVTPLVGIKTPPYTYQSQYNSLISALIRSKSLPGGCPLSFITATNTLGSCLLLDSGMLPSIASASGEGIGGMAGVSLHPLALGNVATIRKMLNGEKELEHIAIIGVGGVSDSDGFGRMRSVGAEIVAVGTAFGREGVGVFEKILNDDALRSIR